ncbi:MAG: CBS domain-containing protein [Gammaproteobacteria bacterium]|jgi:CBS domain-containing protein
MRDAGIERLPLVDVVVNLIGVISRDDLLLHLANEIRELAGLFVHDSGAQSAES